MAFLVEGQLSCNSSLLLHSSKTMNGDLICGTGICGGNESFSLLTVACLYTPAAKLNEFVEQSTEKLIVLLLGGRAN